MLLVGDLNVDLNDSNKHHTNYLSDLTDSLHSTNFVKEDTCFKSQKDL